MADSNATERSEVDGILVSFCEPEPAAAAARRPLKFADRFWGGALCAAAAGLLLLRVAGQGSAAWIERALDPWMRDEARLDLYLGCFITAVFGAGAIACRNVLDDPGLRVKKHAWVISVLAAGVCFVAAVLSLDAAPLHWDVRMRPEMLMETNLSRFLVHFFRAQAVLDLVWGFVFYRRELHVVTSVIHHTAYMLLCNWMLRVRASIMFSVCLLEELPTFIMACGRLNKDLRSDHFFGATYFLLRVLLHTFLLAGLLMWRGNDPRMPVVKLNLALTWCLHTHWFYAWIRQQRRLAAAHEVRQAQRVAGLKAPTRQYGWGSP